MSLRYLCCNHGINDLRVVVVNVEGINVNREVCLCVCRVRNWRENVMPQSSCGIDRGDFVEVESRLWDARNVEASKTVEFVVVKI